MLFLTDWLPRKAVLDVGQRQALPNILPQWLAFALTQRGTDPQRITPVVEAVGTCLPGNSVTRSTTAASTSPTSKPSRQPPTR